MATRTAARSTGAQVRRWLGRGRWGWLVFIAGQPRMEPDMRKPGRSAELPGFVRRVAGVLFRGFSSGWA